MTQIDTSRLEGALEQLLNHTEPFEPIYRAVYVNAHPTKPNTHIVRVLRPDNSVNEETEVLGQVLPWPGLHIRLAHQRKEWSGQLAIVGSDPLGHLGLDVPPINQGKHGHLHGWLQPDETANLFTQQIRPTRCHITSTWTVKILEGYYYINRQILFLQEDLELNLGAYVPGSGGRWVTLSLDKYLNAVITQGTVKTARHSLDAPNPPWGDWWIATVWLDSSQPALERLDVIDARFFDASRLSGVNVPFTGDVELEATGTTTVTGLQEKPVATTAPVDKDVLTYNAALGAWEPKPPETGGGNGGTTPGFAVIINPTLYLRYQVDGVLALGNEVDGPFYVPSGYKIGRFLAYLRDTGGVGGTTIFDLDASEDGIAWTSIYAAPADRPRIAGGAAHVLKQDYDEPYIVYTEQLLRLNLEQVADLADGLIIQLECTSAIREQQDFIEAVAAHNGISPIEPEFGEPGRGFGCTDDKTTCVFGGGYVLPPKYVEGTEVVIKAHYFRDTAWSGDSIALASYVKIGSIDDAWANLSYYNEEILAAPVSGIIYLGNTISFDSPKVGDIVRPYSKRAANDPGDTMQGTIYIVGWTISYMMEY